MGLPEPGLVIYLDMDPNTSRRLLEKRYGGDESRKDLHEANLRYLMACGARRSMRRSTGAGR